MNRRIAGIAAAALLGGATVAMGAIMSPTPTSARPFYADETLQTCGVCHVSPSGGGPRNSQGQAFEAIPSDFTDPAGAWEQVAPGPALEDWISLGRAMMTKRANLPALFKNAELDQ